MLSVEEYLVGDHDPEFEYVGGELLPTGHYLEEAPFIAIEILSDADRLLPFLDKLRDYAKLGTPYIRAFDPVGKEMFSFHNGSLLAVEGDVIETSSPRIQLSRAEVFFQD